jgi:hypothetical protein
MKIVNVNAGDTYYHSAGLPYVDQNHVISTTGSRTEKI